MKKLLSLLLFAIIAAPGIASAAISFDASRSDGNQNDINASSFTMGTGANGMLLVSIAVTSCASNITVSYGGNAMTKIDNKSDGSSGNWWLFYLLNPPSGSNTFSQTGCIGSTLTYGISSYLGASSVEATSSNVTSSGTSISNSITTVTDNDWVVAIGGNRVGNPISASTNVTSRSTGGNSLMMGDSNAAVSPPGSLTQAFTFVNSGIHTIQQVAITPAPPSSPTFNSWQFMDF